MKILSNFSLRTLLCFALVFGASVISAQAGYLYVLSQQNAAPNQIYCFLVNETTGTLSAGSGFPMNSGGNGISGNPSEYLTVDRVNNRLYVINRGSNTVSAFSINKMTGALTALPFSPFTIVTNANTIAVHPSGSPLIVGGNTGNAFSGTYLADSYNINPATATRATGSPFTTGGARPFSSIFSRDGNYYYTGGALSVTFAGFSVNGTSGVLTTLAGSPYNIGSTNTLGYATDTQGRLFTANRADQTLRVFTTSSGVPTVASSNSSSLTALTDGVLSPNEQFYLVVDSGGSQVASYRVSGTGAATTLTQVGSPLGTNAFSANTIVFNQAGTFLFAANSSSRSLSKFEFNPTSGALSNVEAQPDNSVGTTGFLAGMDYIQSIAPTAATVSISGRVAAPQDLGLTNALVTLTDANGNSRTVLTRKGGSFEFTEVTAGDMYVLSVTSKRYRFAPQIVTANEDLAGLSFAPK